MKADINICLIKFIDHVLVVFSKFFPVWLYDMIKFLCISLFALCKTNYYYYDEDIARQRSNFYFVSLIFSFCNCVMPLENVPENDKF